MSEITTTQRPQQEMTLKQWVENPEFKLRMNEVASKYISPDKLARAMLLEVNRKAALQKCTVTSLRDCLMVATQYGWTVGGPRPGMYIVPYGNVATPIPSYFGLQDAVRRGADSVEIEAVVVHEGDDFRYQRGLMPTIEHTPHDDDDAPMTHVYAIGRFKTGGVKFEVMTKAQVDKIRARSRAGGSGPWVTDYEEMAKKTAVRRLVKYLPLSQDAEDAIAMSDQEFIETTAQPVAQPTNDQPARKMTMRATKGAQAQPAPDTHVSHDEEGGAEPNGSASPVETPPKSGRPGPKKPAEPVQDADAPNADVEPTDAELAAADFMAQTDEEGVRKYLVSLRVSNPKLLNVTKANLGIPPRVSVEEMDGQQLHRVGLAAKTAELSQ